MLCSRRKPLNASVTAVRLPTAHHEHPSRAAGSFSGQERNLDDRLACADSVEKLQSAFLVGDGLK